jgi:hypothetical protein
MSFLGKMFGTGKKGEKAPTTGEAIQKLRETEEMLIKKQEFLEKKIEQVNFLSISGFSLIIYNNELKIKKNIFAVKTILFKE